MGVDLDDPQLMAAPYTCISSHSASWAEAKALLSGHGVQRKRSVLGLRVRMRKDRLSLRRDGRGMMGPDVVC